jgi:hypothetical protein
VNAILAAMALGLARPSAALTVRCPDLVLELPDDHLKKGGPEPECIVLTDRSDGRSTRIAELQGAPKSKGEIDEEVERERQGWRYGGWTVSNLHVEHFAKVAHLAWYDGEGDHGRFFGGIITIGAHSYKIDGRATAEGSAEILAALRAEAEKALKAAPKEPERPPIVVRCVDDPLALTLPGSKWIDTGPGGGHCLNARLNEDYGFFSLSRQDGAPLSPQSVAALAEEDRKSSAKYLANELDRHISELRTEQLAQNQTLAYHFDGRFYEGFLTIGSRSYRLSATSPEFEAALPWLRAAAAKVPAPNFPPPAASAPNPVSYGPSQEERFWDALPLYIMIFGSLAITFVNFLKMHRR